MTSVLLLSASAPRDELLSLTMQSRLTDMSLSWLQLHQVDAAASQTPTFSRFMNVLRTFRQHGVHRGARGFLAQFGRHGNACVDSTRSEITLYGSLLGRLRQTARVEPLKCKSADPGVVVDHVRRRSPQFVVANGDISLSRLVCRTAGATVVHLHYGLPPYLSSNCPAMAALYHRDPQAIGAVVAILPGNSDEEILCYPAAARLAPRDTLEVCLARAAAVGAEAVCRAMRNLATGRLPNRSGGVAQLQPRPPVHASEVMHLVRGDIEAGLISRYLRTQDVW